MGRSAYAVQFDRQFVSAYDELWRLLRLEVDWGNREVTLVGTLLDNVSYWLLYLASNTQHTEFDDIGLWRSRFFECPELLVALDRRLATASASGESEFVRSSLLGRVELARSPEHGRVKAELGREYEQLATLASEGEQRQMALASKLGFDVRGGRPMVVVYAGLRTVDSARRRTRINRAFTAVRDLTLDDTCDLADRIAVLQQALAAHKGFATPLEASLEGSGLDEGVALGFLDDYLKVALADTRDLTSEISVALGEVVVPQLGAHAGRYLSFLARERSTPGLPLQGCLDLAFDVAGRVFGVTFSKDSASEHSTMDVAVARQGRLIGRIQINLQGGARSFSTANVTMPARTLPGDGGGSGIPVAMISCRFSTRGSARLLNLQNAHSLLHEFGHAINHVLLSQRAGYSSGLDHLPVERLELMSMWFERWVFWQDLADRCHLSDTEREDLAFAVQVKAVEYRLSHVERGAIAGVDLLMHGDGALDVREAYGQLCDRYSGLRENVLLGDLVAYLGWPMLREKPGTYVSYLWSAAESAAMHLRTVESETDDPARFYTSLQNCLDPAKPSLPVEAGLAVSYYRQPAFSPSN